MKSVIKNAKSTKQNNRYKSVAMAAKKSNVEESSTNYDFFKKNLQNILYFVMMKTCIIICYELKIY